MKKGKRLDSSGFKEKLKAIWDKFMIPLIVTIVGGLFVGLALDSVKQKDLNYTSSPENTAQGDNISSSSNTVDSSPEGTESNDITIDSLENITQGNDISSSLNTVDSSPEDTAPNDVTTDNTTLGGTAFDDAITITSNGTMPRGTTPIDVPITKEMEEMLVAIPKLSVGISKDWVDKKLGSPFATNIVEVTEKGRIRYYKEEMIDADGNTISEDDIVDGLLECVYLLDNVISVTIYFDRSDNSCKAFFVTLLEDTLDVDIVMPEIYSSFVSDKPLGEFAFAEIAGEPENVYGYVSQGVGRAFYGEQHYFMGWGNYQDFYYAVLDYGMLSSYAEFGGFLSMVQTEISPLNDSTNIYHSSDLLIQQRRELYPNTYGISTLGYKITFSLIGTYTAFDSLPLRG